MRNKKAMLGVDVMAYAMKKVKLKSYGEMAKHLWNIFTKLASDYSRIDITFDLCIICSIKETERDRRDAGRN